MPLLLTGAFGIDGALQVRGGPQLFTVYTGDEGAAIRIAYMDCHGIEGWTTDIEAKRLGSSCWQILSGNRVIPYFAATISVIKSHWELSNTTRGSSRLLRIVL